MIDGNIGNKNIANSFAEFFQRLYSGSMANDALPAESRSEYEIYKVLHGNDSIVNCLISRSEMMDAAM